MFGAGGTIASSLFLKYWFSLVATSALLLGTLVLLHRGAASRRGRGPFQLVCAGSPCLLIQPLLLAMQSIETRISFFTEPLIAYSVMAATWSGVGAILTASLWNASVDKRFVRAWSRRRASVAKPPPADIEACVNG